MQVIRLDPARHRQVRRFAALPFALYRDCPQWCPPLRRDVAHALDRKRHPFYRHSEAAFFLAEEAGRAVGRIAVMENRNFNAARGRRDAFFYFFESADDPAGRRGAPRGRHRLGPRPRPGHPGGPQGVPARRRHGHPGGGLRAPGGHGGALPPSLLRRPAHRLRTGEGDRLSLRSPGRGPPAARRVPGSGRRRGGAVGLPPPPLHHQAGVAALVRAHRGGLQPGLRRDLGVLPPHPGGDATRSEGACCPWPIPASWSW